ncbi:hypothetical protein [Xylella fastidiosa]|uniref:Uncharacterized protein n=1 Tax=Xylella fastidiosa subsp. multiplex TaxID=644357 RepID=A0AAW6HTJ7_XYLFS|nr:hypothetical protein [Xylella fastidiosa]KAJ4853805.1 hypothetical protein XYFPCFBP8418_006170 [Xylella fastidiosa subsp. multiplex]MCH7235080.1 hypothetical protein [Xylella fastidiosa subsp. multiplex]MDC6407739.1 hypothetical protein [Xylella fastidiosa subsp. multiplex]MDC6410909.1 hypothetical protein [Xylella fastidiosa subsp. multiplex]MDC6416588.1 hypothetical protein [Xylella fastidiosa subsp. multiplex]
MQAFAGGVVCMTLCHALRVWLQQSADECFGHDTYDWASEIQAGLDCILRNVFVLLDAAKGGISEMHTVRCPSGEGGLCDRRSQLDISGMKRITGVH